MLSNPSFCGTLSVISLKSPARAVGLIFKSNITMAKSWRRGERHHCIKYTLLPFFLKPVYPLLLITLQFPRAETLGKQEVAKTL